MSALAIFEYVITFEHEVNALFRKRQTVTSLLYVSVRWVMVLQAVLQLLPNTPGVSFTCTYLDKFD